MPLNEETVRLVGQKSKRGKAKKPEPNIKEKITYIWRGFESPDHDSG